MRPSLSTSFLLLAAITAHAADPVPVPKSSGAVPVTATSRPFGAEAGNLHSVDLAKHGYVEEEFLLSGTANVYDWDASGAVSVRTPNAPYTNRILIRRPASASKFSGTVWVEITNAARRYDWAMMWGYGRDQFLEHGDAWVGLTLPAALDSLKKVNPARYASLSMANPAPNAACPGAAKGGPSSTEEGLRWDYYSQVAAALQSNAPGQPMTGMKVQRVFLTTQGVDITTYINAFHDRARLANGKPAYDGYLVRNPPVPSKTNQCAPAIAATDPRRNLKDIDVPIIAVVAQGEVPASMPARKPDSDAAIGKYRLYEIAGAAHIDAHAYTSLPGFAEQEAVGTQQGTADWPFAVQCEPPIPLSRHNLLMYAFHAAYRNLSDWVAKGIAPPKGALIEMKNGEPVVDPLGEAVGGVRNPWVDVPVANYTTSTPGGGSCRELGEIKPFSKAKLDQLYPSAEVYASKVNASVDQVVKARYFTESDGKKMKAELPQAFPK